MKQIIWIILALALMTACAGEADTMGSESAVSAIQPAPPFVPGKEKIALQSPVEAASLSVETTFTFNASNVAHAALLVFSSQPSANEVGITDMSACVAGITSMNPAHPWDDYTATLGATATTSEFYRCDPNNTTDPLTNTKIGLDTLSGTNHWVVLGYDSAYHLTHSSELRSFTKP